MSSAAISESRSGALLAWETGDNVFFATVNPKTMSVSSPISPGPGAKRKHPIAVASREGETLFAWTEGTGWARGGSVAWQVFDKDNRPTTEKGRADGVPAWSLVFSHSKTGRGISSYLLNKNSKGRMQARCCHVCPL